MFVMFIYPSTIITAAVCCVNNTIYQPHQSWHHHTHRYSSTSRAVYVPFVHSCLPLLVFNRHEWASLGPIARCPYNHLSHKLVHINTAASVIFIYYCCSCIVLLLYSCSEIIIGLWCGVITHNASGVQQQYRRIIPGTGIRTDYRHWSAQSAPPPTAGRV